MNFTIIRNYNFIFLCLGNLVAYIGEFVYLIALPWLMLDLTGSKSLTSAITASSFLPALFFGIFFGVIIDKYNKKYIMIYSNLNRLLLVLIIPFCLISNSITPFVVAVTTFLLFTFTTFFVPARDSLLPGILNKVQLSTGNSILTISSQISHLLAPIIAGMCVSIFSIIYLFIFCGFCFFISSIIILLINKPFEQNNFEISVFKYKNLIAGISYIFKIRGLSVLLFLTCINNIFIMGPAIIGLPVFVSEALNADFIVYAKLETAMALGMIVGSIIYLNISKIISINYVLLLGIIIDGATFSILYFVKENIFAIIVLFIHGIGIPLITVSRTNIIQIIAPKKYVGRLLSIIYMTVMGTTAVSILITGLILENINIGIFFLFVGFCAVATVFIGFISRSYKKILMDK